MLSKIEFFETKTGRLGSALERESLLPPLHQHLQLLGHDAIVTPALGGTLGVCFDINISGEPRFLKTHIAGTKARAGLVKEADVLLRLYGNAIVLDRFDISLTDGTTRHCLLMPKLAPLPAPIKPEAAATMAREWVERFGDDRPQTFVSFEPYLTCAARALTTLSEQGLLDTGSAAQVRRLIASSRIA